MCTYANSGCNGPIEGECVGLCLHRINTETMTKRCAAIKGNVEQRTEPTRIGAAWDAYKAYRCAGRIAAIRRAVRAFFR